MRRTVVVTGASTGIGEACVARLCRAGWRVFAGIRRDEDGCRLRDSIGDLVTPVHLDVTDEAGIAAATEIVGSTVEHGLNGLVNNAGIAIGGPLEFVPIEALRRQLEVNVVGQVAVTQAFLPLLRQARGRIVNMGSIGGIAVTPFIGPYCASKFALEAITDALRMELAPWGIEVAIVEPGGVATPIWTKGADTFSEMMTEMPPEAMERYGHVMERMRYVTASYADGGMPPDEVARAVQHALESARPRTRYIVGKDARLRRWVQRLPDRIRDRLIRKRLGT